CLFGKDGGSFTYTTELYGETRTLHAYNADGSAKQNLGVGIETVAENGLDASAGGSHVTYDGGGLLVLWPFSPDGPNDGDGTMLGDLIEYTAQGNSVPF